MRTTRAEDYKRWVLSNGGLEWVPKEPRWRYPQLLGQLGVPEHPEPPRPVTFSNLNMKIIFYMSPDVKEDESTDLDLSTRVRDKPITRLSN